jgi:hypothetical protein
VKFAGHRPSQGFHQKRFPYAWNSFDQRVSTGEQRHQREIDGFVLPDNYAAKCFPNTPRTTCDYRGRCRRLPFRTRRLRLPVRTTYWFFVHAIRASSGIFFGAAVGLSGALLPV